LKLIKLKSIINNKLKRYFLYAIGEFCLIVLGILFALYINNRNSNNQYKKQIDSNILRVHSELEINIKNTQKAILKIKEKDSLIFLVMNDSIKPEMYYNDINLAYLILYFHNLNIEDKAYQNLMALNISDNTYRLELISELKELYSGNQKIIEANDRMSTFVYDKCLPFLAKNTKSFGDLTYKGKVKKDVADFLTNSKEYKSYVSQYAIIAIKNQLRHNQNFLKKAYTLNSVMTNEYNIQSEIILKKNPLISNYKGLYSHEKFKDTLAVKLVNDSIILYRDKNFCLNLIPITEHSYYTENEGGGYFVSFSKKRDTINMKLNLLSEEYLYKKIQ
jgi:hypothetical protein